MKKVVIVGFGSIGKRHYNNFVDAGTSVAVVTRRPIENQNLYFNDLGECLKSFQPDVVFITNETHLHFETLAKLKSFNYSGLIIVEKPIFDLKEVDYNQFINMNIRVSYNLRYSPLLKKLKADLAGEQIVSANIYVGQNLRTWRPQTDYRQSYSADEKKGGGVLLDLSHELDYALWLFGEFAEVVASVKKISDLEITAPDSSMMLLRCKSGVHISIEMNYIDHIGQRFIIVNTNKNTFRIDLVSKVYSKNGEIADLTNNIDTYKELVTDVMQNGGEHMTSYAEGISVLKALAGAHHSSVKKEWCTL